MTEASCRQYRRTGEVAPDIPITGLSAMSNDASVARAISFTNCRLLSAAC